MMTFLIVLLSIILVADALLLILLVLVQLPKKEAGAGLAFGAGATDALFGAGSGNALTKLTKWASGIFLGVALLLSLVKGHQYQQGAGAAFKRSVSETPALMPATNKPGATPASPGAAPLLLDTNAIPANAATNTNKGAAPAVTNSVTNAPKAATNVPATPSK